MYTLFVAGEAICDPAGMRCLSNYSGKCVYIKYNQSNFYQLVSSRDFRNII